MVVSFLQLLGAGVLTASAEPKPVGRAPSFQASFADCVISTQQRQARRFVVGAGVPPMPSTCLSAEWAEASFRAQTYRYMLARVLLQQDYPAGLPLGVPTTSVDLVTASHGKQSAPTELQHLKVADCVVRAEPGSAFALVATDTGDPAAKPIMAALAPAIAKCPGGSQLRYPTGFEMHEAIVTRMYQLAFAARKPSNA